MRISVGENELSATVSVGVAVYPMHGSTGEEVLHVADKALYIAKEAGRNRVAVWKEECTDD